MPLGLLLIMSSVAKLLLGSEAIFASLRVDLCIVQERKLLGCIDVGHLFDETLGEDDIDFLEGAVLRLRVEEVDNGQEASVDCGEEEVCA